MRTKKYWDNRYNDFCNKILGEEIYYNLSVADVLMDQMLHAGVFYKENTENGELTPEQIVLYFYINHGLNLYDPIGCCYPHIRNEYSSYAWKLVDKLLNEGIEKFPARVKRRVIDLYIQIGSGLSEKDILLGYKRIIRTVNKIYKRLEAEKNLQKDQFNEKQFWDNQIKAFQYKVLGNLRKEYVGTLTFLKEERDKLIDQKEENMKDNYEDFIQFLYINHHLNLLDPTKMYYPQFHYQYEDAAWEILSIFKSSIGIDHPTKIEKVIKDMFVKEGCDCEKESYEIKCLVGDMLKELQKMNK